MARNEKTDNLIPLRRLGRTELLVSCIGLGGMGVISQNHPDRESASAIVHTALDRGVNFIDTARSYFDSEDIIGYALSRRPDSKVILASKTYMRSAKKAEKEIQESFEALGVKKIPLYQCHHVQYWKEFEEIKGRGGVLEVLRSYQKQGLIDHIGVSSHNPEIMPRILEEDIFDTAQFPFSPIEREYYTKIKDIIKQRDLGTIIMKPLAGGNLTSVEDALRYLLSHPVSTVIPGCSTVEHVIKDTEVGHNFKEISEEEKEKIIAAVRELPDEFCRRCRYCEKRCPQGIQISDIFRCEDYLILSATYAREQYKALDKHAPDCINCGKCESICPYHLPVRKKMKMAHRRLSKGKLEDLAVRFLRKVGLYDTVRMIYFKLGGKIPDR